MSQGERNNPVQQFGPWDILSSWFIRAFEVRQPIEELAEKFRIDLERSWDQLAEVKVAYIRVGRHGYALVNRITSQPRATEVWLLQDEQDEQDETAVSAFLRTLGLTEEDVLWRAPAGDEVDSRERAE